MKALRLIALLSCVSLLSACQTVDGLMEDIGTLDLPSLDMSQDPTESLVYQGQCPRVEAVEDLKTYSEFTDISDPGDYNLISRATIAKIDTACSYDEKTVTIDLKMAFEGTLGLRARSSATDKPYFSYPFFVAVTSPSGDILAKEIFAAGMTYPMGQNRQTYYENMRQIIPVENRDRGARYKVLVGFQLNPDQLAHNRKRLKEDKLMMDAQQLEPTPYEAQTQQAAEQAAQQYPNRGNPIDITGQ